MITSCSGKISQQKMEITNLIVYIINSVHFFDCIKGGIVFFAAVLMKCCPSHGLFQAFS